jgi:hypothetical protein
MGVTRSVARFLVEARARGADFSVTGMVGRQSLFIGPLALRRLLAQHGLPAPSAESFESADGYAYPLLRALGAKEILAIDASPFEGADIIQDLNQPVPEDLHQRFTTLYDGGSLEHVFDVPTALRNYMQMVRVGGTLIIHTMANNFVGHGFYQFSPELFYRVLTPENGYEIERVVLTEQDMFPTGVRGAMTLAERRGPFYEVTDPVAAGGRVLLQGSRRVVINVQARRVAEVPVLVRPPQQSDYVVRWTGDGRSRGRSRAAELRDRVGSRLSAQTRMVLRWDVLPVLTRMTQPLRERREHRRRSFANSSWYREVD